MDTMKAAKSVMLGIVMLTGLAGITLFASETASAHTTVWVGAYKFVIGWQNEPAYTYKQAGVEFGISTNDSAIPPNLVPITGQEKNFEAHVHFADKELHLDALHPLHGRAGWYGQEFIFTRPGVYEVHIEGTVKWNNTDTPVDIELELHEVHDSSEAGFPEKDPSAADLEKQASDAKADAAAAKAAAEAARAEAEAAKAGQAAAMNVAYAGIAMGLVGIIIGAMALMRKGGGGTAKPAKQKEE
jgi:hypothetical protein